MSDEQPDAPIPAEAAPVPWAYQDQPLYTVRNLQAFPRHVQKKLIAESRDRIAAKLAAARELVTDQWLVGLDHKLEIAERLLPEAKTLLDEFMRALQELSGDRDDAAERLKDQITRDQARGVKDPYCRTPTVHGFRRLKAKGLATAMALLRQYAELEEVLRMKHPPVALSEPKLTQVANKIQNTQVNVERPSVEDDFAEFRE